MLSVPYEFYKDIYGGTMSEADFIRRLSSTVVDVNYYTSDRLVDQTDDEADPVMLTSYRELCCRLVDDSVIYDQHGGAVVLSSSSGKVSESYAESSLPRSRDAAVLSLIEKYLGRYNLTCRWV